MSTFALVHGAWHGAWVWERLRPELEARGHAVLAPELPSDDPGALISDYARVAAASLADAEDVVLVAHSLALSKSCVGTAMKSTPVTLGVSEGMVRP